MAEPWFEPNTFGALFGAIVGGGGGTLIGIFGGVAGSYLIPRGKGRGFVLGTLVTVAGLGLVMLAIGIYALVVGQPYGIWYPILLCGVIFSVVCGSMVPAIRKQYAAAEQRRLEAESIRSS